MSSRSQPDVSEDLLTRALDARDQTEAIAVLRTAVSIPSITGEEEAVARWSAEQLEGVVDVADVDVFAPGRANLWARWGDSSGSRRGLAFVAHTDVVTTAGWSDVWVDDPREDPFAAAEADGAIWGRGVADCKGGLAAAIAAVKQLHRAGLHPAAPLTLLFVADEESGEEGSGVSAGVQRAIERAHTGEHPIDAELVVYGEPSDLDVLSMHLGFFVVDLVLTGKSAYFGTPELGVDALAAAEVLLPALRRYGAELAARPAHPEIGAPALLVTAVAAGGTIAVPGECTISMIRKLTPGEDLDQAQQELEAVVAAAGLDPGVSVSTTYPSRRDHRIGGTPFVLDPAAEVVARTQRVVRRHRADAGATGAIPGWSEAPFFHRDLGLPTVYLGVGSVEHCHTPREHVRIADYLTLVDVYVELISQFCGLRSRARTTSQQ